MNNRVHILKSASQIAPVISIEDLERNPVTEPIMTFIRSADPHQLFHARKVLIPHCKGASADERAALEKAVDHRFGALNLAAANARGKRWKDYTFGPSGSDSLHTQEDKKPETHDGKN